MSRLLLVVQRYGEDVLGGAETACRGYAEQLAARGHDVTVLTSCAIDYADWHDHFPQGTTNANGVRVRRLGVVAPRDPQRFGPLHDLLLQRERPAALAMQHHWARAIGPDLLGLEQTLLEEASRADAAIVFTYLYATTTNSLAALPRLLPTVVIPFAHEEAYLHLPIFQGPLRAAHARGYMTEEEAALVDGLFGAIPSQILGIGFDGHTAASEGPQMEPSLGNAPYLLYLGRIDPHKGSLELLEMFDAFRSRHHEDDLRLVVAGEPSAHLSNREGIVSLGFVDEAIKHVALAGCLALVQPSYVESFSMVLCEAWLHGRPVLVQGRSDVLRGQVLRAGGGLTFEGFASFEASVEELLQHRQLASSLGEAGRRYVHETYAWDAILTRLMSLVEQASDERQRRQARARTA